MVNKIMEKPKVFVSYCHQSHSTKTKVKSLSQSLHSDGIDVIIDQEYLKQGHDIISFMKKMVTDPQIHKVLIICDGPYSEKANKRIGGVGIETQIISKELNTKADQTKFIPVVFERDANGVPCMPHYLKNRFFIDLSTKEKMPGEYKTLIQIIFEDKVLDGFNGSVHDDHIVFDIDKIKEYPLMRSVYEEVKLQGGISYTSVKALSSSTLPHRLVEKFMVFLMDNIGQDSKNDLFGIIGQNSNYNIAVAAVNLINSKGIGREAVEYFLSTVSANDDSRKLIFGHLSQLKRKEDLLWAHTLFTRGLGDDDVYLNFIKENIKILSEYAYDDIVKFLIYPDRGPGNGNINSIAYICSQVDENEVFISRWQDWILGKRFDGKNKEGDEYAGILYDLLNVCIKNNAKNIDRIKKTAITYCYLALKSDEEAIKVGFYHLMGMIDMKFLAANEVLKDMNDLIGRIDAIHENSNFLFMKICSTLSSIEEYNKIADNDESKISFKKEVDIKTSSLEKIDTITDYWKQR